LLLCSKSPLSPEPALASIVFGNTSLSSTHADKEKPLNTTYLTAKQVTAKFNITSMTLHRWLRRADMKFPTPTYINNRRYFIAAEVEAWESYQRIQGARQ
jgi:hypothetical protein